MGSKTTILIRGIDEPMQYTFNYTLEDQLKKIAAPNYLTLDSLSDSMIIPYIDDLTKNNHKIYLVFDLRISANPGVGRTLLNKFIKQKNVQLLCIGDTSQISPFLRLYQANAFNTESELISYFSSN